MKLYYDGYERAKVRYKFNGVPKVLDVADGCEIIVPDDEAEYLLKSRYFSTKKPAKVKAKKGEN